KKKLASRACPGLSIRNGPVSILIPRRAPAGQNLFDPAITSHGASPASPPEPVPVPSRGPADAAGSTDGGCTSQGGLGGLVGIPPGNTVTSAARSAPVAESTEIAKMAGACSPAS